MSTNFDVKSNKCEICNQVASSGILDENQNGKIRYTCQEHYIPLYERMIAERKEINK